MKKNIFFTALLFSLIICLKSQPYTWIAGSNAVDQPGHYGVLGVPDLSNNPGGRQGAVTWKDSHGNFWLFGGYGFDALGNLDLLNDLWKFNITIKQWEWIAGDTVVNQAGVYGMMGLISVGNKPGSRHGASSWKDASGNMWLFGGFGLDSTGTQGYLNDIWKFDISFNTWVWIKGSKLADQIGNYGTQNIFNVNNNPGSRYSSTLWQDPGGEVWCFGGQGFGSNPFFSGALNDFWKYDPSTNQWMWVTGNNQLWQQGNYGTIGVPTNSNNPGSRFGASGWIDGLGFPWLFGGFGADGVFGVGELNDLWKFDYTSNQWVWINGDKTNSNQGIYGSQGISSPTNKPGSRYWSNMTLTSSGDVLLFGGYGWSTSQFNGNLNDLWKYNTSTNEWTWVKGSNAMNPIGNYGIMNQPAITNNPGGTFASASWTDGSYNLWLFGGYGFDGGNNIGELNDLWKYGSCDDIKLTLSSTKTVICNGQPRTTTITASGASTYTWSNSKQTPTIVVSPSVTTTYSVTGGDSNGCLLPAAITLSVLNCQSINEFAENSLSIYPNPSSGDFTIQVASWKSVTRLTIYSSIGQIILSQRLSQSQTRLKLDAPAGVYLYEITSEESDKISGKLIIH